MVITHGTKKKLLALTLYLHRKRVDFFYVHYITKLRSPKHITASPHIAGHIAWLHSGTAAVVFFTAEFLDSLSLANVTATALHCSLHCTAHTALPTTEPGYCTLQCLPDRARVLSVVVRQLDWQDVRRTIHC